MKNARSFAKAAAAVAVAGIVLTLAAASFAKSSKRYGIFCDLNLRYNEVSCSHDGVNPFRVWSHEIVHERYQGLKRPDMPEDRLPDKKEVHAYPPWHTTFFWWYPWLPRWFVQCGVLAFNFLSLIAIGAYFAAKLPATMSFWDKVLFCFSGLLPCAYVWGTLMANGNYSAFVTLSFLAMILSLKRGHDVLAGICWVLMMVKPQLAALAFWPLLFAGKVKTMVVAAVVLAVATFIPSFVYGESPLELVWQVPQIGLPYIKEGWASGLLALTCLSGFSEIGNLHAVVSVACFALCGAMSWAFSKSRFWMVRFVPMILFAPLWSYSLPHDRVFLVYLYFTLGLLGYSHAESRWGARAKPAFYVTAFALAALVSVFPLVAGIGSVCGIFGCSVMGPIYKAWQFAIVLVAWTGCAVLAFNLRAADGQQVPLP